MSAIIDYIFRHKFYTDVLSSYAKAKDEYNAAYAAWVETLAQSIGDDYKSKVYIHHHIDDIKQIDGWVYIARKLLRESRKALEWFFHIKGIETLPKFHYKEYKLIADNYEAIKKLIVYLQIYDSLISAEKEAIDRFLNRSSSDHSFEEIKSIATSKAKIKEIGEILKLAHTCKSSYHKAWDVFAQGSDIDAIPLDKLKTIDDNSFNSKDLFLSVYYKNPVLCKLVIGEHDISSFKKKDIEDEEDCYFQLLTEQEPISLLETKVQVEGDELKRAILDSRRYGTDVKFADDYTISNFYQLRQETDDLELEFDDVIAKVKNNYDAIKAFNYEKSGKSVVYIQDYLRASKVGTPLYNYIETFREQKDKRDNARRIASNYPLGFACLFDSDIDLDLCELSVIMRIIDSEPKIIAKESEEAERERKRREEERRRREEEEKREKVRRMKACVSKWHITRYGFPHDYLYEYLKINAPREADEYEWDIRNLIWAFKNDPNKQNRRYSYHAALNEIVPKYERKLRDTFGSLLSEMTLVCLPASSSVKNSRRWQEFSRKVCSDLDMWNAYEYIHIEQEATPKHLGGDGQAVLSFDRSFFNGKYVILCDDIKTTGSSIQRMKCKLESMGATVICSLTIGITIHE